MSLVFTFFLLLICVFFFFFFFEIYTTTWIYLFFICPLIFFIHSLMIIGFNSFFSPSVFFFLIFVCCTNLSPGDLGFLSPIPLHILPREEWGDGPRRRTRFGEGVSSVSCRVFPPRSFVNVLLRDFGGMLAAVTRCCRPATGQLVLVGEARRGART